MVWILAFMDFFTLVRWSRVSSDFIPHSITKKFGPIMNDQTPRTKRTRVQETMRFLIAAQQLRRRVLRPMYLITGKEITFPGMADPSTANVSFLGRGGDHNLSTSAIRDIVGVGSTIEPPSFNDYMPDNVRELGLLKVLQEENRNDRRLMQTIGLLQRGTWTCEFYPERWDTEEQNDATAILTFETYGIVGVLIFTEILVEPHGPCSFDF